MTLRDEVLRLVLAQPGITDAELARRTGKRHQAVNAACRELAFAGRIHRQKGFGSIGNHPTSPESGAATQHNSVSGAQQTAHAATSIALSAPSAPLADGELAQAEREGIAEIARGVAHLRRFLAKQPDPDPADPQGWFTVVSRIREIQGNISNDASLLAGILARHYLVTHANVAAYDSGAKAQGAAGLDIDQLRRDGRRIVGEVKTTVAHLANDLGAQQRNTFLKDFAKLASAEAHAKYFFLTGRRTFEIVRKRYARHLPGVTIVLLPDGDAFTVPPQV